jgi:hypothetical protein
MTERRQFCPKGHDTFVVGRDTSYRCLACKRESMAAARRARIDEAMAVERAAQKKRWAAADRAREAGRRRILRTGGQEALPLLQQEAWEDDRCGWEMSLDPPAVCGRKISRKQAEIGNPWCSKHDAELERARRGSEHVRSQEAKTA